MSILMKSCIRCNKELELDNFSKDKNRRDGHYPICKECVHEYNKKYRVKAEEKRKIKRALNKKVVVKRSKEYKNEYNRQWRENHKEYIAQYGKEYLKNHLEDYRARNQLREARKRDLISTLTAKQWLNIKLHFNEKCCYCGRKLPLEQEHFIALSKQGEYSTNNIIPACRSCNAKKSNASFEEWYPKYKYYSIERETNILQFIQCNGGI